MMVMMDPSGGSVSSSGISSLDPPPVVEEPPEDRPENLSCGTGVLFGMRFIGLTWWESLCFNPCNVNLNRYSGSFHREKFIARDFHRLPSGKTKKGHSLHIVAQ